MNFKNFVESSSWILESAKLINNFPDIILYLNHNGDIIQSNEKAKEYFKLLSNITISEIIKDGMKQIRNSIKQKKSVIVKARGKDGEFYAELTASRFDGNYCVSLRNKTPMIEEINQKNSIEKFNNEKNVMISKIENDIKSPINSIIGFSQGMLDGIADELSEKQIKYLKIISTNAVDLQEFVDKFIDFSYCESSLYEYSNKKIDIINLLKEIVNDYSSKINTQKINIYFTYENFEDRYIYIDENALKKAISNILETSLVMTENGIITIHLANTDDENSITYSLNEEKRYFNLIIKDTGIGIPAEEMIHVCNPYAQLEKGKKNILRSFRLGIASILIKRLKGFINISSDKLKGTFYNIIIPAEKEQNE